MVRDEPDLEEWVAYQFVVGFDHVRIYDNESVVPVWDRLAKWIEAGKVSVEWVEGRRRQTEVFGWYLDERFSRWVAFIDADEFVLPHATDSLKELLCAYEAYGGLAVSWAVFGPDGHVRRPNGLMIESYTRRGSASFDLEDRLSDRRPTCQQYKTIVQPRKVKRCLTPHFFQYRNDAFAVNEMGSFVPPDFLTPPSTETVQLNHYMTKSAEDWELKKLRRGGQSGKPRSREEWLDLQAGCIEPDLRIQRFAPAVRDLMERYGERTMNGTVTIARPQKTLRVGPWVGEFGWELCWWNPMLRKLAEGCERVIVAAPKSSRHLYEFADEFIGIKAEEATHCYKGRLIGEVDISGPALSPDALWKAFGAHEFRCIRSGIPVTTPKQWRCLGEPEAVPVADVLCAFRPPKFVSGQYVPGKEYPRGKCEEVVGRLLANGLTVACYGGKDNYWIEGTIDLRGLPIEVQCAALGVAKAAVGPSSGPIHLASLCRCPHVTWSAISQTVGIRYRGAWNPFGAQLKFLGPEPSPAEVVRAVTRLIWP
jgi:hypothetical protein